MKVTIMGLGLNGGGFAATEYFAKKGDEVTVTDLRSEEILKPTIDKLSKYTNIRYVLEKHNIEDFENADLVIKNPAVKKDSIFLQAAKNIQTDITVFLSLIKNPIIAVTGSKGKSTTVKAIDAIFKNTDTPALLGGNITISPLSFIDEALKDENRVVILELSSWQLADINYVETKMHKKLLQPKIAVITNILNDHQNAYNHFSEYVNDKKIVFKNVDESSLLITEKSSFGKKFKKECNCKTIFIDDMKNEINFDNLKVPGKHFIINMKIASLCAKFFGISNKTIQNALEDFNGVPYRLEKIGKYKNITFYNDSAATMPDAMLAACCSFKQPIYLITGGTDKKLDIDPYKKLPKNVKFISLLFGSLTTRILELKKVKKINHHLPVKTMDEAVMAAVENALQNEKDVVVLLSPGASSFELFLNEFDRGDKYNSVVKNLVQE